MSDDCGMSGIGLDDASSDALSTKYQEYVHYVLTSIGQNITAAAQDFHEGFNPCDGHVAIFMSTLVAGTLHMVLAALRETTDDMTVAHAVLAQNLTRIFSERGQETPFSFEPPAEVAPAKEQLH